MKMKNRVLAVLALALLMINMAPVKRVEAASEVCLNARQINLNTLPSYQKLVEIISAYYDISQNGVTAQNTMVWANSSNRYSIFYDSQSLSIKAEGNSAGGVTITSPSGTELIFYYADEDRHEKQRFTGAFDWYYLTGDVYKGYIWGLPFELKTYSGVQPTVNLVTEYLKSEPDPLVLPVTEPGYEYWLYHKTTSGEYMYWSKAPFDLEVSEGKYILNLSTGDIVYRLHLKSTHTYYRQIISGNTQYAISSGDVFRSGQDISFDGIFIGAWLEGDVTSEEAAKPQYDIPHITKFLKRIRSARSYGDKPREYSFSIDLELSGEFDSAVTEQKVLIDGNYFLPSEEYFRYCDAGGIDPSTTHFMNYVKGKQEKYYILVDWSHIESIVNLAGLTSDYGFRLTYSNAIDALIERGEFDKLYSKSVQAAYSDDIRKLCCPYRLACTLIGVVDGENYYGDTYITVLYSEVDNTVEDVSGVYSDYVSLDNGQKTDAIESTINSAQDDKLQEYIDKKDAELDALIEEYEMKLAALDTTLSSGGTGDLFGTFSSVANGLAGLSGSFRGIAIAVGNVFAFFPEEITGLLFAGIVAMIVIAVYKALRG